MDKNTTFITFLSLLCILLTKSQIFIDYGVEGEGKELYKFFHDVVNGYYVDLGAYDPIFASNTLNLYVQGWDGIHIQANPERLKRFNMERSDQINLNFAVGEEDVVVTLYELEDDSSSTISPKIKDYLKDIKPVQKQIKIPAFTLKEICQRYYKRKPLFMNIDVQGYGGRVLQTNDWTNEKCIPEVIFSQLNEQIKISGYPLPAIILAKHGYKRMKTLGLNQVYVRNQVYDKYVQKISENQIKVQQMQQVPPYNIIFLVANHLNVSSQIVKHYQPKTDPLFYKFARKNEPIELEIFNRQSNLLNPRILNRPIVIFHFDTKSNYILLESSNYTLKRLQIMGYRFWEVNVTISSNVSIRTLIFDHEFYSNPQLRIFNLAKSAKQLMIQQSALSNQLNRSKQLNQSEKLQEKFKKTQSAKNKFTSEMQNNEKLLSKLKEKCNQNIKQAQQTFKSNKNLQISLLAAIEQKLTKLEQKIGKPLKPKAMNQNEQKNQKQFQSELQSLRLLQLITLGIAIVMGFLLCITICIRKQKQYSQQLQELAMQRANIDNIENDTERDIE